MNKPLIVLVQSVQSLKSVYRFLRRQVRWSDIPICKNFPQLVVILTVKVFGIVNKAKVDVFLKLSCFFDDPMDVGSLISGSSAFTKSDLNIWKFMVHILLKPGLENFEHYFVSIWDECNCVVQFSCSGMSDTLWPHGLQHTRPPWPSSNPGVHSNTCPLSRWCHPTISSSVIPFSSLQSFPASGSFLMNQPFASCGQSIGVSVSASVLPMNIQGWFPLGWTGWMSL